jgi:hypothetical protein
VVERLGRTGEEGHDAGLVAEDLCVGEAQHAPAGEDELGVALVVGLARAARRMERVPVDRDDEPPVRPREVALAAE